MRSEAHARTIARIYDAALMPDLWPAALQSVGEVVGVVGAGYCIQNRRDGQVDLLSVSGPLVETGGDYIDYFHARDLHRALIEAAPRGRWVGIRQRLPETALRRDEWYNDFLRKAGIDDAVGTRLFQSQTHTALFGISHGIGQAPFATAQIAALQKLSRPLRRAARLQVELNSLGWKSPIALRALDRLGTAVIVTHGNGRVIELNRSGERILRQQDGLTLRSGRLEATNVADNANLAGYIAAAATRQTTEEAIGRMRIGRHSGRLAYAVTVAPLGAELGVFDCPMAIILISDPDEQTASERDLADYFGLSPAESRLAVALMAGRRLRDVAIDSGVQMTTLRSQLSSILRKVGVERQSELIGVLSRLPFRGPFPAPRPANG
jgi:DNA-binding CsgD family transcriptional regulator